MVLAAGDTAALRVVATTPDLGSLVRTVGGDLVVVDVLAKPTEDPHFIEARPSFVKLMADADLLVLNGMELEAGYLPTLLASSRNTRIQPGSAGYFDASKQITPLGVPTGTVDRSMGDVHAAGSPHYLLDPLNGARVGEALAQRLAELRPAETEALALRAKALRAQISEALVGRQLAAKYDVEKLVLLHQNRRLMGFLESQGDAPALGGWLGALQRFPGAGVVDDHPTWLYFATRFGLVIEGHLEGTPGIPPTTKHLAQIVETMKAKDVRVILANAYYDPRYADFIARNTGARVLRMANQVGVVADAGDYLGQADYNVRQVVQGLSGGPLPGADP